MLKDLYKGCRTYRRFEQKEIKIEDILDCLDNARISSSARNAQPLRYIYVQDKEVVKRMQEMVYWAGALPKEIGTPKVGQQPVSFIVIYADKEVNCQIDVGIAANTIATSAWEKGIGSCLMGAIDRSSIQNLLSIPETNKIQLVIALGYPSHSSQIVDMNENNYKYYVDEERNYYVPKRKLEDVVEIV